MTLKSLKQIISSSLYTTQFSNIFCKAFPIIIKNFLSLHYIYSSKFQKITIIKIANIFSMEKAITKIIKFKNQRNWSQFHNVKDLLLGLNIEIAELQELVLWKSENQIKDSLSQKKYKEGLSNEIADIFIFLIYLTDKLGINLEKAVIHKIKIHEKHYPISKSKNHTTKYNI